MLSSQKIRTLFLDYFRHKGHSVVPSHSMLPPKTDHSLLFINAGMAPYKSYFERVQVPPSQNMVSIQRCLRAGGKHNDLENVGYTPRHHTFFEMLGNFSFGGYFKREAIQFAFEFLTDVLKIPKERLWVTVYENDQETAKIWLEEIKFDAERLTYCGAADNFWMMGDTGPCGPCTEIFYDHGPLVEGGPPGSPDASKNRYIEIWNIVFMQYLQQPGKDDVLLPIPCVDTGMGLERLAAVMQGVVSNYDTDLFQPIINETKRLMHASDIVSVQTLQVIADHIRAISFLIFDGVIPNNEGRGYVLRRIIRRALRHIYQIGIKKPFLYQLIPTLIDQMKTVYPELLTAKKHIEQVLLQEEKQFLQTLHQGIQYFNKSVATLKDKILPGPLVFKLYDTYGFPADLTADLLREKGLSWDKEGFTVEMEKQKNRSKNAKTSGILSLNHLNTETVFDGYDQLEQNSRVLGLVDSRNQIVDTLCSGEKGYIIVDHTPFYAEAGGQVGDQGEFQNRPMDSLNTTRFVVSDTQKQGNTHLHIGRVLDGQISVGDVLYAKVDAHRRQCIKRHHSATHLLHAALQKIIGSDVVQKGSLVTSDNLRFDFQCPVSLTTEQIQRIENFVNQVILENLPVITETMSLEEAKAKSAMALFDEKYGKTVRVLRMGNKSIELCGGTHVAYTGQIGCFKIILSSSIAAGVKRIEAVAGEAAILWIQALASRQNELIELLNTNADSLIQRVHNQVMVIKKQADEIETLQTQLCQNVIKQLTQQAIVLQDTTVILGEIPQMLSNKARFIVNSLKSYLPSRAIVVVGCLVADRLTISIGISKQCVSQVSARTIIELLITHFNGKGGGRDDFAQFNMLSDEKNTLFDVLETVRLWLHNKIGD